MVMVVMQMLHTVFNFENENNCERASRFPGVIFMQLRFTLHLIPVDTGAKDQGSE